MIDPATSDAIFLFIGRATFFLGLAFALCCFWGIFRVRVTINVDDDDGSGQ